MNEQNRGDENKLEVRGVLRADEQGIKLLRLKYGELDLEIEVNQRVLDMLTSVAQSLLNRPGVRQDSGQRWDVERRQ